MINEISAQGNEASQSKAGKKQRIHLTSHSNQGIQNQQPSSQNQTFRIQRKCNELLQNEFDKRDH